MSIEEDKKRGPDDVVSKSAGDNKNGTMTVTAKKPKVIRRKYKVKELDSTSPMGVLQQHINDILAQNNLTQDDISNDMKLILNDKEFEQKSHRIERDVEIVSLSSSGDGLALIPHPHTQEKKQIAIVPFGLPGDVVSIKVFKSHPTYVESDLLEVIKPSDFRDDSKINCKYFGKCSGCQFQSVDYEQQLIFKRQTIENAYKHLAPQLSGTKDALPAVSATEPSPLQYSYRTKLTPHFNLPYKLPKGDYPAPMLGFGAKGRPTWRGDKAKGGDYSVLDIEECSIGTEIINLGMKNERAVFHKDYKKYKKGATILLREDTKKEGEEIISASRTPEGEISKVEVELDEGAVKLVKSCVTDPRQIVTEYVNGYTFEFSAGEFFQNNNSILPAVTNYVKENLTIPNSKEGEPNYLVDAYCGSGLFSITCSTGVSKVIGVEVSADSVKFAERNAKANNIENARFIHGKAEQIFGEIDTPASRTSVILDPPRKGCDDVFLNQLSEYNPRKVVYISCNVHSQARDVDWFINNTKNGSKYIVESIKGFDFFPQTHHVESIAVLTLKE
ncbi:tRNA (uracil(54)-C(5))-methyltransferase [[Candida] railenensis]|uniref:tRNA (uracil(54)-C(5))-methyltransferase n=1 Tax=[Candida] railenensis TaxID=45579 RepID=A0A9P0W0J9_9ASCO|nr:tRNA (uracil(54)-C(5))-methyltransferase [[Candida] railenensis]